MVRIIGLYLQHPANIWLWCKEIIVEKYIQVLKALLSRWPAIEAKEGDTLVRV
jgi:hypothetical protein